MASGKKKQQRVRSYDASGRQRRAQQAQARALEVAARLFAAQGYAETTMEAIAREAEVAVPTLYAAFGSKRGMLSRLLDRLVSGEPDRAILETSRARAVLAEPDPRRVIALFSRHIVEVLARVSPTYHALKSAARSEPELAELHARVLENRFANLGAVVRHLAEASGLRPGLSLEEATRTMWLLTSPESRELMLSGAGYTGEAYADWLERTLAAALLPDRPRAAAKPGG